jgi:hypothetical protein
MTGIEAAALTPEDRWIGAAAALREGRAILLQSRPPAPGSGPFAVSIESLRHCERNHGLIRVTLSLSRTCDRR